MIDLPPIDELREVRRRLAEESGHSVDQYAAMLAQTGRSFPGEYLDKPLAYPRGDDKPKPAKAS